MSWMYQTEINFLTQKIVCKLQKVYYFQSRLQNQKFAKLQINKILNTDANRVFSIPFKVMYISSLKKNSAVIRSGYFRLFGVNENFSLTNGFVFLQIEVTFEVYNKKRNNYPLLSKPTLKYQVYCQFFLFFFHIFLFFYFLFFVFSWNPQRKG